LVQVLAQVQAQEASLQTVKHCLVEVCPGVRALCILPCFPDTVLSLSLSLLRIAI
jgi:hypothetical protein